ncbi:MAG: hypothetical protein ACTSYC_05175 [Promethearchaeota archaeon]
MLIGIEQFTELDIIRAWFSLLFVLISIIIGLRILIKYRAFKRKELITVGLTWIFLSSPWWPLPLTFILAFVFNSGLDPLVYRYLMSAFIPFVLICWIYSINVIVYSGKKRNLLHAYLIICIGYSAIYHVLFFINPDWISVYSGGFQFNYTLFVYFIFIFTLLSALITGFIFALESVKSQNIIVRWKGRFFFLALLVFISGALMDTFSFGSIIIQTIARIVLTISSLFYYLGFFLPKTLEILLTKKDST